MSELFKAPIARLAHALTDLQQLHPSSSDINECFERARDATNDLAAELTQAKARIAELESERATLLRDLRYLAAPNVTGMGANLESEHELASAKRLPSVVRWAEQTLRVLSKDSAVSGELTQAPPDLTPLRELLQDFADCAEQCHAMAEKDAEEAPGWLNAGSAYGICYTKLRRLLDALEAGR